MQQRWMDDYTNRTRDRPLESVRVGRHRATTDAYLAENKNSEPRTTANGPHPAKSR